MNNTYKCPSCGGPLTFDQSTQKLTCPYCGYEQDIQDFEEKETHQHDTDFYLCSSCGGEVILDTTSGATSCPFCDNPIVLSSRFTQDFKPDFIVPFKNKREDILDAFEKHLTNKKFVPQIFKDKNLLKEIKGIYVPYWIYDLNLETNMQFKAVERKETIQQDKRLITSSTFDIMRLGKGQFKEIPISASKKMDETMLDSLEPFDLNKKVNFTPDYLAGFFAENYDTHQDDKIQHVLKRCERTLEDEIIGSISYYDELDTLSSNSKLLDQNVKYALLPIWFLTTRFNNEEYTFAMNGESGKLIGDLPFDKSLYTKHLATRFIILFVILYGFASFVL